MSASEGIEDRIGSGSYARKQLHCRSRFIAWSHRSRFEMGRKLISPFAGGKLLDYGCGDGTFLALARDDFPDSTGADLAADHIVDCNARLGSPGGLRFVEVRALADPAYNHTFDVITCMETLEHCTPETVEIVAADLGRLLKPGGRLLVSVPVEIGPSLLGKELVRGVAAWRKLGDYAYKERYTWRELLRMTCATADTAIDRPAYPSEFAPGDIRLSHGHKGFNWKRLRRRLEQDFVLDPPRFSPLNWSRGWLSSQVWLAARSKPADRR